MKNVRLFCLSLLFCLSTNLAYGQFPIPCLVIELNTQGEVSNFWSTISNCPNNPPFLLVISGAGITSLEPLSSPNLANVIDGYVVIENTSLTSLAGLENLSVDEAIIVDNPFLSNCEINTFCDIINNGGTLTVENNAVGCAYEDIASFCGLTSNVQVGLYQNILENNSENFLLTLDENPVPYPFSVVADGTHSLSLSHEQGIWTIRDYNQDPTTMGLIEQVDLGNELRTHYTAPKAYTNTTIFIDYYTDTNPSTPAITVQLNIVPPPVVLLHGLYSSGDTWPEARAELLNQGWSNNYIATPSYDATQSFQSPQIVDLVFNEMNALINNLRSNLVFVNQGNIVGHSMGGLVARSYLENYTGPQSKVYKLITIGTPHSGARIADIAIASSEFISGVYGSQLALMMMPQGVQNNRAIQSLRTGSPEIISLNAAPEFGVPVHAITSDWATCAFTSPSSNNISVFSVALNTFFEFAEFALSDIVCAGYDVFLAENHDGVVGVLSQSGGLSNARTDLTGNTADYSHIRLHKNEAFIDQHLANLLSASPDGPLFNAGGFTPVDLSSSPNGPLNSGNGSNLSINFPNLMDGQTVNTKNTLTVELAGSNDVAGMIIAYRIGAATELGLDSVFSNQHHFSIPLPQDFAGTVQIVAMGTDGYGLNDSKYITLNISPRLCQLDPSINYQACLSTGIVFSSQSQIDNFKNNYPICNYIEGDVRIAGTDIQNIDSLDNIIAIKGSLLIDGNSALKNINGLRNLDFVEGFIRFYNNDQLTDISAFDHLTCMGDFLSFELNDSLSRINTFNQIASIPSFLLFIENEQLAEIKGFNSLAEVRTDLRFENNPALKDLSGLEHTALRVGRNLNLVNCDSMSQLAQLNLRSVGGDFVIFDNEKLASLVGLDSLSKVDGLLAINNNDQLVDLVGLGQLDTLGSHLWIFNNDQLLNLDGLDQLDTIGGGFWLAGQQNLVDCSGLDQLKYIGEYTYIFDNAALERLQGLQQLAATGGYFYLTNNPQIEDLSALSKLESLGGFLGIEYCPNIESLVGLQQLQSIGGSLYFNDNILLSSMQALANLSQINGPILLDSLPALSTLSGLDNISPSSISNLVITHSPQLALCDVMSICSYLDDPSNPAIIDGNLFPCNSRATLENQCLIALPVELLDFYGKNIDRVHQLHWRTASETGSDYFSIEHSLDGLAFQEVGTVQSVGYADDIQSYAFTYHHPKTGLNYYRLKQVDRSGNFEYSPVIGLENHSMPEISIYPNPVDDQFYIQTTSSITELRLYDNLGQLTPLSRTTEGSYDLSALPRGVYFLYVSTESDTFVERLLKN
ncbi:MAG: alpha/beta fold hydrolase [Bacteroidota bacterium]